jgi:hypothetical protein
MEGGAVIPMTPGLIGFERRAQVLDVLPKQHV